MGDPDQSLLLLLGFAVLSNQFEQSALPEAIPSRLPDGWVGGVILLGFVFLLSIFLDNIAGAIIGGVAARHVFANGITTGFLAAIVAAANAGGGGQCHWGYDDHNDVDQRYKSV